MKNLWTLLQKDLLRDAKRPGGLIVFMVLPVVTAYLMALVFGPKADLQKSVVVRVAVLDQDDDFLSRVLRSISSQGETAKHLQLHFVDSQEAGIGLVEKRKVSAFVEFPPKLMLDLLDGRSTAVALYKNPAEVILPKVVDEGLQLLCLSVSSALRLIQPELKEIRGMVEGDRIPDALEVAEVAGSTMRRLRTVEPYLLPPLVQMRTVAASDFVPTTVAITNPTPAAVP